MARPRKPLIERFWSNVEMIPFHSCWEWKGGRVGGYGNLKTGGRAAKKTGAHRISYEIHKGSIPTGLQIDHLCRNRGCVNPNHLEAVTQKENLRRGVSPSALNSKKKHCHKNHPLSGDNLYVRPNGDRCCRACDLQRNRLRHGFKNSPIATIGNTGRRKAVVHA